MSIADTSTVFMGSASERGLRICTFADIMTKSRVSVFRDTECISTAQAWTALGHH